MGLRGCSCFRSRMPQVSENALYFARVPRYSMRAPTDTLKRESSPLGEAGHLVETQVSPYFAIRVYQVDNTSRLLATSLIVASRKIRVPGDYCGRGGEYLLSPGVRRWVDA